MSASLPESTGEWPSISRPDSLHTEFAIKVTTVSGASYTVYLDSPDRGDGYSAIYNDDGIVLEGVLYY